MNLGLLAGLAKGIESGFGAYNAQRAREDQKDKEKLELDLKRDALIQDQYKQNKEAAYKDQERQDKLSQQALENDLKRDELVNKERYQKDYLDVLRSRGAGRKSASGKGLLAEGGGRHSSL